jgi:Trk K+ transport system NAD-binding subunit
VREAVATRLSSVRDFLLLFFFVGLGSRLSFDSLGQQTGSALVLSVFVLVGNPLIVMAIMGAMGYRKRTGFLAGLTVAQISEFSLIFMAMGLSLKQVDTDAVGLVTVVGLVTITLSTYMILYSHQLYRLFDPYLGLFERRVPTRELANEQAGGTQRFDVIVFGLGRYGLEICKHLEHRGMNVLGIDFDPEVIRRMRSRSFTAIYGDAEDPEFAVTLPLQDVRWVVIAIPPLTPGITHEDARLAVMESLRYANYKGRIAVRTQEGLDTRRIKHAGADVVLSPFNDAAQQAADLLTGETGAKPEEPTQGSKEMLVERPLS